MRLRSARTSVPEAGFTVIELTVTVAVLTLVVGSLLNVFVSAQRSQSYVTDRSEALDNLRLGMDRMSKEIRQATVVSAASTSTTLTITTYVNGVSEIVTWRVSGSTLERVAPSGTVLAVLSRVVAGPVFTYSPSVAGPLVIRVLLRMTPPKSPSTTLELTSEIRLRNQG